MAASPDPCRAREPHLASEPTSVAPQDAAEKRSNLIIRVLRRLLTGDRVRWELGALIVAVTAVVLAVQWNRYAEDRTGQIIAVYFVAAWAIPAFTVWWLFLSGLKWWTRAAGIGLVALLLGVFFARNRLVGFTGDFIMVFAPRGEQTPEDRAVDYFGSQSGSQVSAGETAKPLVVTNRDWPQFRGPLRTGIVEDTAIRRDWKENPPRELWSHPVGVGWSSFSVVDGLAFTQEQRGPEEVVVCYDVETGKQIWAHSDEMRFTNSLGGDGPRATPTVFDSRLYTLGAMGNLNCLEPRTGKVIWSRNILDDAGSSVAGFGMCTSPFIFEDKVVVNAGGGQNKGVIAYDRKTGDIIWAKGDRDAGYASPVLATFDGLQQLLIFGAQGLAGHDAHTGEELWWFDWKNDTNNNCADPILLDDGKILLSSGYSKGTVLLSVSRKGEGWTAEPVGWETSKRFKLKISGALLKDGFVYGLDENILCCFDPATGQTKWKSGRYGYGQLLLIDDVILITSEKGDVALVEANPERYKEIAKFHAVDGKTWNHPALYRGLLLVRNDEEAACFDLRNDAKSNTAK